MIEGKVNKQPLGSKNFLDRIISSSKQQAIEQQTQMITIIYAKYKLQMDVPVNWSINKLKCMVATHFQMLSFDKFQFQCNKFLIPGKTLVANLPKSQLIITQADCQKSFENYYQDQINKIFKKYKINSNSKFYPITHPSLGYSLSSNVPLQRQTNLQQIPPHRAQRLNQQNQPQQGGGRVINIINMLRLIGIIILSNIIFSFANFSQVLVLIGVALIYYIMDFYVNHNERGRRQHERQERQERQVQQQAQRQPNLQQRQNIKQMFVHKNKQSQNLAEQEKQQEKEIDQQKEKGQNNQSFEDEIKPFKRYTLKAKLILLVAFLAQTIYCYSLSLFPNWTIETHLHANREKLDSVMDKVKQLDPQASQAIKNWKNQKKQEDKLKAQ